MTINQKNSMNREEVQMLGFEIVAYAGEATSTLMKALSKYTTKEYVETQELYDYANGLIVDAHKAQTKMLQAEALGEDIPYSFTMVHGQDHLMSAVLLRDVIQVLLSTVTK